MHLLAFVKYQHVVIRIFSAGGRGAARGGPMRTSFFAPLTRAAGVPAKKSKSALTHTRFAFLGWDGNLTE